MRQLRRAASGRMQPHLPKKSGFLWITRGFLQKNPTPEILTRHGLQAITGVLGDLFQLQEYF